MVLVTDVKAGMTLEIDDRLYRVLEAIRHAGSGQMHGFIELKLKDIRHGHLADKWYKHGERLHEVELINRHMEFIYSDDDSLYFMDPETFEQVGIKKDLVREKDVFLREGMRITVEFHGDQPITVEFQKIIEMKVAATGPGIRDGQAGTMKSAILENNLEILVPQFVETGDLIRVDTEKMKYVERVIIKKI